MATFSQQRNSQIRCLPDGGSRYRIRAESNVRKIAIVIFHAKSNRLKDLLPLVPACLAHIESIQPGQIVRIEG